ncbi:adenylate kinase [Thalassolituus sp. HI0120]|nr:adenylate kinase [Thalassolituus sp. HI0120]KZZ47243.1 adenylate kinase [Thalassolituus sp. HI0120]
MKKVAVFGKPGSGKLTFSKRLAEKANLPLIALDSLIYNPDGTSVERPVYTKAHDEILSSPAWLIDGLGPFSSFYQRLEAASTLIYIDLPYWLSYWLVTKRLIKGLFVRPAGWPEGSSVIAGSIQSYRFLRLSPQFWNAPLLLQLEQLAAEKKSEKTMHHVRSLSQLNAILRGL